MNILPLLPDRVRKFLRKEAGRTIGCRAQTNLVVSSEGLRYPLCSFCLTTDELKRATPNSPDRDHPLQCRGVRIIGESGRDYRMGEPNVDISGIYTKDEAARIRSNGRKLFEFASLFPMKEGFSVALVSFQYPVYRIFGSRTGKEFPIGSKLLLAELPFEIVDDRFEPKKPRPETEAEFDRLIRASVNDAVNGFRPEAGDSYDDY